MQSPAQAHEFLRKQLVGHQVMVTFAMSRESPPEATSILEKRPCVLSVFGELDMEVTPFGDIFTVSGNPGGQAAFWCEDVLAIGIGIVGGGELSLITLKGSSNSA